MSAITGSTPAAPPRTASGLYSYLTLRPWSGGDETKPNEEIINGIRVEKQMGAAETRLANILNEALGIHLRANHLGQSYVGMEIELPVTGNCRKPDVAVIAESVWPRMRPLPEAWWRVCPSLVVEVISPRELTHATLAKVHDYFTAGVAAVWLVLPNLQQVYCYSSPTSIRVLTAADELSGDPVFPGFRMPLAELFPRTSPA